MEVSLTPFFCTVFLTPFFPLLFSIPVPGLT